METGGISDNRATVTNLVTDYSSPEENDEVKIKEDKEEEEKKRWKTVGAWSLRTAREPIKGDEMMIP